MERKACARCGSLNLEAEQSCWACSGRHFVPPGTRVAGEPTESLGAVREPTLDWKRPPRRVSPAVGYAAASALLAVVTCLGGVWIGRASAPEPPGPVAAAAVQPGPEPLPNPPDGAFLRPLAPHAPAPSLLGPPSPPSPPPSSAEAPFVTVRPGPARDAEPAEADPAPPPTFLVPQADPDPLRVPLAPLGARPATARVTPVAPASPPPAEPPRLRAAPNRALVSLRNGDSRAVEVRVDGNGSRSAVIAPGDELPLTLEPGTYTLRADSGDAASASSVLALAADRAYTVVVQRRRRDGRETLALVEPAIEERLD